MLYQTCIEVSLGLWTFGLIDAYVSVWLIRTTLLETLLMQLISKATGLPIDKFANLSDLAPIMMTMMQLRTGNGSSGGNTASVIRQGNVYEVKTTSGLILIPYSDEDAADRLEFEIYLDDRLVDVAHGVNFLPSPSQLGKEIRIVDTQTGGTKILDADEQFQWERIPIDHDHQENLVGRIPEEMAEDVIEDVTEEMAEDVIEDVTGDKLD